MIILCNFITFGLGAFSYALIEILWRGHTHWSMMIAGGLCFLSFSKIAENCKRRLWHKCIIGSICVTVIEFVFGVIFNIILKKDVWDYSDKPFNLFGQVCLLFSVLWGLLGIVGIPLAGGVRRTLKHKNLRIG